jgi:hypothetical protein
MLAGSENDTYPCVLCGALHVRRGLALRCCSDRFEPDRDDPDAPPVSCDGGETPDQYRIPSVAELDDLREAYDFSRAEFSRQAGREVGAWSEIVTQNIDPRRSTLQRFLDVLRDADTNGERPQQGRTSRIRSDGGPRGDSQ